MNQTFLSLAPVMLNIQLDLYPLTWPVPDGLQVWLTQASDWSVPLLPPRGHHITFSAPTSPLNRPHLCASSTPWLSVICKISQKMYMYAYCIHSHLICLTLYFHIYIWQSYLRQTLSQRVQIMFPCSYLSFIPFIIIFFFLFSPFCWSYVSIQNKFLISYL